MSKHENLKILRDHGINVPPFCVYNKENCSLLRKFLDNCSDAQTFAVRSSANVEDGKLESFAGLFKTFLNINKGELQSIVNKCFRQSTAVAKQYDYHLKNNNNNIELNVIIQLMISSNISGVLFTRNPTNENNMCVIEAAYGLCEGIVSGQVSCDRILCNIEQKEVINYNICYQKKQVVPCKNGTILSDVDYLDKSRIKLSSDKINTLLETAIQIRKIMGTDIDIEWGFYQDVLYIFQARPITT